MLAIFINTATSGRTGSGVKKEKMKIKGWTDRGEHGRASKGSESRGSTGNMRTAYKFFDIDPYSNCERLAEQVQEWAVQVHARARMQIKAALSARGHIAGPPKK